MALSDYDHLSYGPDGTPSNGVFVGLNDYVFQLYKNWVYMSNETLWREGSSYIKPTIAEIRGARLEIEGNTVVVEPSLKASGGILVFITSQKWDNNTKTMTSRHFAGIACSGYDHNRVHLNVCRALNVDPTRWEPGCIIYDDKKTIEIVHVKTGRIRSLTVEKDAKANRPYETRYVGVTKAAQRELISFLEREIDEHDKEGLAWLAKVKKVKALRYNAGDAFFAANGVGNLAATEAGDPTKPVLMQMLNP